MGQRVRQGMDLKLEADLDDVERRDTEPGTQFVSKYALRLELDQPYREISPAILPARTTCRRVPYTPINTSVHHARTEKPIPHL